MAGSRVDTEELVERLLARCGENVPVVIDSVLPAWELFLVHPGATVADTLSAAVRDAVYWQAIEPIWTAWQGADMVLADTASPPAGCAHCAPPLLLSVAHHGRSGSMAEQLHDMAFGTGGTADYDRMLELVGPFRWAAEPVVLPGAEPAGVIEPRSAPQLWAQATDRPGFFFLRWSRTTLCQHREALTALAPESIRKLVKMTYLSFYDTTKVNFSCSGPALNFHINREQNGGTDIVPCVYLPWWPDKEGFLNRRRAANFPPAAVRRDICQFGVHLVPTGCPGSDTEKAEWRLSLSRAELVAALHLSVHQRATVRAVKYLKIKLKDEGAAPAMKSYYVKTAVLWLIQDERSDAWTSVLEATHTVLDWLERHFTAGRLPCFFWAEIDILSGLSGELLDAMLRTVRLMRSRATPLLLLQSYTRCPGLAWSLLEPGAQREVGPLTENQLRLRLARLLLVFSLNTSLIFCRSASYWDTWTRYFVPPLARLSEGKLLAWRYRRDSGAYRLQVGLLCALLVAPDRLVAGVRLSSADGGLLVWDAAPLLRLLTDGDLQLVLGEPAQVEAWWRRSRPGQPADLSTPRGRAEILLQLEPLRLALREMPPCAKKQYSEMTDDRVAKLWAEEFYSNPSYLHQTRELWERMLCTDSSEPMDPRDLDDRNAINTDAFIQLFKSLLQYLLTGDRLRRKWHAAATQYPDRWGLKQFVVVDQSPDTGKASWHLAIDPTSEVTA